MKFLALWLCVVLAACTSAGDGSPAAAGGTWSMLMPDGSIQLFDQRVEAGAKYRCTIGKWRAFYMTHDHQVAKIGCWVDQPEGYRVEWYRAEWLRMPGPPKPPEVVTYAARDFVRCDLHEGDCPWMTGAVP